MAETGDDIDAVWAECDGRLAIIQGLTAFVADKAGIKVDKVEAKAAEPVKESVKDSEPEKKVEEKTEEQKNDDKGDDDDDGNPMSFFAAG